MRMLPSAVGPLCKSDAERRVFDLLAATEIGRSTRCFHSLNIVEHEYKKMGELDFVIVSRDFFLALEIKGGQVGCDDGIWTSTDRYGIDHHSSEGPFRQARSGMFSLLDTVKDHFGPTRFARWPVGYGVVLPDSDFKVESVEWRPEMIANGNTLVGQQDLLGYLDGLAAYWSAKIKAPDALGGDLLEQVSQFLRPDFDRVPSLRARANDLEVTMERLTDEQYLRLDAVEENERILCEGGAGTGKTFLALELCRRESERLGNVLLVTRSPILAAFLKGRLGATGLTCLAAEQLGEIQGQFSSLIVDEGQDLLDLAMLGELDRLLEGGLEHGRWRVFYDQNNQAGLYGPVDVEAVELLLGYRPTVAKLTRNCRNTRQIVLQTRLMTAADLGNPLAGQGPTVLYEYFDRPDEEARLIASRLDILREEGVSPGEITVVTGGDPQKLLSDLGSPWSRSARVLDVELAGRWPVESMTIANVRDFKGMENMAILFAGIVAIDADLAAVATLYVGMSRARGMLWLAVPSQLKDAMDGVAQRNLASVGADMASFG